MAVAKWVLAERLRARLLEILAERLRTRLGELLADDPAAVREIAGLQVEQLLRLSELAASYGGEPPLEWWRRQVALPR